MGRVLCNVFGHSSPPNPLLMMSLNIKMHTRNSLIDIQHLIMTMIASTSGESWTHLRCVWSMVMILISHQISWLLLPSPHAEPLIETGRRSSKPSSCLVSPPTFSPYFTTSSDVSFSPRPLDRSLYNVSNSPEILILI